MTQPRTEIRANGGSGQRDVLGGLEELRVRPMWRFVTSQPISFWLVCLYFVVEYFRPQTRFPAIDVIPWGKSVLALALVALFAEGRFPKLRTAAGPLILLFLGVVVVSSVFAVYPAVSFANLEIILGWVVIYLIITNVVTTEGRFFIVSLLFVLLSFRFSQFAVRTWVGDGFQFRGAGLWGPQGWFNNPGELGIQLCILVATSAAFYWGVKNGLERWKKAVLLLIPASAVIAVIATNSRGAQLGLAALLAWGAVIVAPRLRTFVLVGLVAVGGYVLIPDAQMERWLEAGDDETSQTRQDRWDDGREIMDAHPFLGIGYANWLPYYYQHYTHRERQGLSHNILIDAGAELGYTGLLAFLLLVGVTFHLNRQTRRWARGPPVSDRFLYCMAYGLDGALVAFLVTGQFVSVLYYPYFWINLAMTVSLNVVTKAKRRRRKMEAAPGYADAQRGARLSVSPDPRRAPVASSRSRFTP